MADSNSKTPTPRDRQAARQQGRVALSSDLATSVSLIGSVVIVYWNGPRLVDAAKNLLASHLSSARVDAAETLTEFSSDAYHLLQVTGECALLILTFVLVAWMIQTGALFAVARVVPDYSRINPVAGWTRLLSMENSLQACFNLLKIAILGAAFWLFMRSNCDTIASVGHASTDVLHAAAGSVLYHLLLVSAGALIVWGVIDYALKRNRFETSLVSNDEPRRDIRPITNDPSSTRRRGYQTQPPPHALDD
ncbi:MAG: EscU/YscU/HrcU family type III secretion system export apparatus switch protein [Planctomycetales bacterium]|nr:EscU/YscU/HrcU family type III secretion system export apparatus switch protein [Planctomycetales bacterium]